MNGPIQEAFKTVDGTTLHLHIFRPDTHTEENAHPAIVFFFCGGWRGFDYTRLFPRSAYLASRGMVCLSAEVRVAPVHGTPAEACVIDAKSAIRYVRTNAEVLGIDPNRIAAGGGSAAGCVTACRGVVTGFEEAGEDLSISSRPDAMVLFNPRLDTVNDRGVELFGSLKKAQPLSPVHRVKSGNPPSLIMHGTADKRLDVDHMRRFEKAMQDAGNRCDLRLYEGAGHGFFNFSDGNNPWFIETLQDTDQFFVSLGYLEGTERVASFDFSTFY